jgi:L-threonylcarbamoyladenylate synthase
VESTIVDARDPRRLRVLRPGAITVRAMTAALRRAKVAARFVVRRGGKRVLAPGTLARHYSPRTPLQLAAKLGATVKKSAGDGRTALIFWRRPGGPARAGVFWLTERGDPAEAARRLYAVLRAIDAGGFSAAYAECAPKAAGEIGAAVNDRLRRAAAKR